MDPSKKYDLNDLLYLMSRLRNSEDGCPWDCKQDFESISTHTLEEAYEVVDAIEHKDYGHLCEELGDLLFQVVFYGQLAEEANYFNFADIVDKLVNKLLLRHRHVFPDGSLTSRRDKNKEVDLAEISQEWEKLKIAERKQRGRGTAFEDIPLGLSALIRSHKLQKRASTLHFDWSNYLPVVKKIHEELGEVLEAVEVNDPVSLEEELGDLLFACVNLSRHLGFDSERALRIANTKFERRFEAMLALFGSEGTNKSFAELSTEDQNNLWQAVKKIEKKHK